MTSHKIPFRVVYRTSEEEGYPATELENSNPHTKGWHSEQHCSYPQEIVLAFDGRVEIKQIQLLSHESKVATRVDVYVDAPSSDPPADWTQVKFERLGFLPFNSNEKSNYGARELKSVLISKTASFLRLVFKKNHINQYNLYNQVGLVALHILGTTSDVAPWDDLSVNMELDEKTLKQIRLLNAAKARACNDENYDEAKRLKGIIDGLKEVGSEIAQLERKKMKAVRVEDYDLAKQLKFQIDQLRSGLMSSGVGPYGSAPPSAHSAHRSFPAASHHSADRMPQRPPSMHSSHPQSIHEAAYGADDRSHLSAQNVSPEHMYRDERPIQPAPYADERPIKPAANNSFADERPIKPAANNSFADERPIKPAANNSFADERPLRPAANNSFGVDERPIRAADDRPINGASSNDVFAQDRMNPADERPLPTASGKKPSEDPFGSEAPPQGDEQPEPIKARHRKDADPLIPVFGEHDVKCLFSSKWVLREQALGKIAQSLEQQNFDIDPHELFVALARVLKVALADKVAKVFISGTELLGLVIEHLSSANGHDMRRNMEPFVSVLCTKLANSNARVRTAAAHALFSLACDPNVTSDAVYSNLLRSLPDKDKGKPIPLKARGELLVQMLRTIGLGSTTPDSVMHMALEMLPHRAEDVRNIAIDMIAEVYLVIGPKRMAGMIKNVRPGLKNVLETKFDEVQNMSPQQRAQLADDSKTPQRRLSQNRSGRKPAPAPAPAQAAPGRQPAASQQAPPSVQEQQQQFMDGQDGMEDSFSDDIPEEGFCQFCGREDPSLTHEKLDLHYWQECPMLTSCKQCEQVIEIPALNEHLLTECDFRDAQPCPRCHEPIVNNIFAEHVKANNCRPAQPPDVANRCPLCHDDIPPGVDGWKQHLFVNRCPKNERTNQQSS